MKMWIYGICICYIGAETAEAFKNAVEEEAQRVDLRFFLALWRENKPSQILFLDSSLNMRSTSST